VVQASRLLARHPENLSNTLGEIEAVAHGLQIRAALVDLLAVVADQFAFPPSDSRRPAVIANVHRLGLHRARLDGSRLDDNAGLNEWCSVAGRHSENESDVRGCDKGYPDGSMWRLERGAVTGTTATIETQIGRMCHVR
jgi:hypothetical protein